MKRNIVLLVLVAIIAILAPIVFSFVLLLPSCIPEKWIIGDPNYWHTFWPNYIGAVGTLLMAIMTYKTLRQNDHLIKAQNTPKLSCSLAVGKDCLYIEIKNTTSVPAYNVKVSLTNNTTKENIFDFDSLCNHLSQMSFDIPPFETKLIPIRGIQPVVNGKYEGYLSTTLTYDDKTETYNMYLKEINVTKWKYDTYDLCNSLKDINSSIDEIKRNCNSIL